MKAAFRNEETSFVCLLFKEMVMWICSLENLSQLYEEQGASCSQSFLKPLQISSKNRKNKWASGDKHSQQG